jgi:hypothetical protein
MKINNAVWNEAKKKIEEHLQDDKGITDVTVKLKVRESAKAYLRNYLQITITI